MIPYFFPSRIVLIDDEPQVLRMNTRLFEAHPWVSSVVAFSGAAAALEFLAALPHQAQLPAEAALVSMRDDYTFATPPADGATNATTIRREVSLQLSALGRVIAAPQTREVVATIVCDYAMPGMNGLQFFDTLAERGIRRVLLTALCDEQRAVQAFNAGTIHKFIQKADPAGPAGLERVVEGQMREFFRLRSATVEAALRLGEHGAILAHPGLDALAAAQFAALRASAYSFVPEPLGYRVRTVGGGAYWLLLADAASFDRAARATREIDGPPALVQALQSHQVMPFGRLGSAIYEAGDAWSKQAVTPQVATGASALYWAVVPAA